MDIEQGQSIQVGDVWHPQFYPTTLCTLYEVVELPVVNVVEGHDQTQVVLKHLSGNGNLIRRTTAEMFKGWVKKEPEPALPAPLPMDVVLGLAHDVKMARVELSRLVRVKEEAVDAVVAQRKNVEELRQQFYEATQELLK